MTVIIGVGVVAMLQLLATGTVSNVEGTKMTTGMNFANSIHELTLSLNFSDPTTPTNWGHETGETTATYDDIDDLDGKTFSPPIDARRVAQSNYTDWSQQVTVESVDPDLLTATVPDGTTPTARVTCKVLHKGREVYAASWLAVEAD